MKRIREILAGKFSRWSERLSHEDIRRAKRIGVNPQLYRCINRIQNQHQIVTVLDVGANMGSWAEAISRCLPAAEIHCFEPIPECIEALKKLALKNSRINPHHLALGDFHGASRMNLNTFTPSSSLLSMGERHRELWPESSESREIEVPVSRLDDSLEHSRYGIFLKIDVQGFELNVLRGAQNTLKKCSLVVCETLFETLYQGQAPVEEIIKFMRAHGVRVAEVLQQHRTHPDRFVSYADIAFVPEAGGTEISE